MFLKYEINMLSPEDIASDAFPRIFKEIPNYQNSQQKGLFSSQEGETASGHISLKTFFERKQQIGSQQCSSRSQKSPSRHISSHSPFSKRRLVRWKSLNSVKKTKSSALPPVLKASWKLKATASAPDLKIVDRNIEEGFIPGNNQMTYNFNQGNEVSRKICYYNLQLWNVILKCIIVAIGLIYFACATAIASNREMILFILNYQVYVLSLFSLYVVAIMLLVIAIGGLCFTPESSKKIIVNAFVALFMAAILISLAFIQNSAESKIQLNAESKLLSNIHFQSMPRLKEIWDYFHETFKCCGVRGYLDWCIKDNFRSSQNVTIKKEYLGSLVCSPPISCCLNYKTDAVANNNNQGNERCIQSATPWNSYKVGCITPIKTEIYFLGKVYRTANFGIAIILVLSAITSVTLLTYI